jgi:hypothetical protein
MPSLCIRDKAHRAHHQSFRGAHDPAPLKIGRAPPGLDPSSLN